MAAQRSYLDHIEHTILLAPDGKTTNRDENHVSFPVKAVTAIAYDNRGADSGGSVARPAQPGTTVGVTVEGTTMGERTVRTGAQMWERGWPQTDLS